MRQIQQKKHSFWHRDYKWSAEDWFITGILICAAMTVATVIFGIAWGSEVAINAHYDNKLITAFLADNSWHQAFVTNVEAQMRDVKYGDLNGVVAQNFATLLSQHLTNWNNGWFGFNALNGNLSVTNAVLTQSGHLSFQATIGATTFNVNI